MVLIALADFVGRVGPLSAVVRFRHARHNFPSARNESAALRLPGQPSPGFLFHDTP